ncbi:HTH-type transcriptional activator RhaR [Methylobacterium crusticola]|uniref:HTH-type transcriptional activator RhaR n=1 Tax=Methylobacterium crusticola TaxID=1697972 RepID=A0ABQ4QYS3_9HYPH|nr:AraC family transcriptional regulator [Methylobacterium crusticola]GJD49717.1 HTH-type transcriptional activator RhaR [Methylobacterium crusticola]
MPWSLLAQTMKPQIYKLDTSAGLRARIAEVGARLEDVRTDTRGDVIMHATAYERREGAYEPSSFLWLYLCTGGGGALSRRSAAQRLDGLMRPARVGIGAPHEGGAGYWPDMSLLALGVSERRLTRLLAELPGGRLDVEASASRFHDDPLLTAALTAMWQNSEAHGMATAFFDHAVAVVVHRLDPGSARASRGAAFPLTRRQVAQTISFIDAHLGDDLGVEELARIAHLSPHHFSRCFRRTMGLPPYAFITRRRLDRAGELLANTTAPVAEIAGLVGYASPSQFTAAFRRHAGLTPLAWRRSRRA